MNLNVAGRWAFIIGIVLAVLAGFTEIPSLALILLILGLIVGFLNIKEKENTPFLVAVIALMVIGISGLQLENSIPTVILIILENFLAFVSAAGLIVALKQVLAAAKSSK